MRKGGSAWSLQVDPKSAVVVTKEILHGPPFFFLGLLGAAVTGFAATSLSASSAEARVVPANPVAVPATTEVAPAVATEADIEAARVENVQFVVVRRRAVYRRPVHRVFYRRPVRRIVYRRPVEVRRVVYRRPVVRRVIVRRSW
jgi:hypothetical protein